MIHLYYTIQNKINHLCLSTRPAKETADIVFHVARVEVANKPPGPFGHHQNIIKIDLLLAAMQ